MAVHVAREAVARARWDRGHSQDVWLFAASSRGNAGEFFDANAWRRPSRRFRASNTMHSEIAAAVSIELGLRGPWQMLSNGCSAGLDALGLAWMALRAGLTQRALVVAVDLPLVPQLLQDFRDTRLLSNTSPYDPLAPTTTGFIAGEGAAAVTLEISGAGMAELVNYGANSDAYDSLVVPPDGAPLAELVQNVTSGSPPDFICPHATGTLNHARAEIAGLRRAYDQAIPPLLLLKPFTGHTLGASGLLDVALLAAALQAGALPGNVPALTAPPKTDLFTASQRVESGTTVLKIASGMGGHNAAVILRRGNLSK